MPCPAGRCQKKDSRGASLTMARRETESESEPTERLALCSTPWQPARLACEHAPRGVWLSAHLFLPRRGRQMLAQRCGRHLASTDAPPRRPYSLSLSGGGDWPWTCAAISQERRARQKRRPRSTARPVRTAMSACLQGSLRLSLCTRRDIPPLALSVAESQDHRITGRTNWTRPSHRPP